MHTARMRASANIPMHLPLCAVRVANVPAATVKALIGNDPFPRPLHDLLGDLYGKALTAIELFGVTAALIDGQVRHRLSGGWSLPLPCSRARAQILRTSRCNRYPLLSLESGPSRATSESTRCHTSSCPCSTCRRHNWSRLWAPPCQAYGLRDIRLYPMALYLVTLLATLNAAAIALSGVLP